MSKYKSLFLSDTGEHLDALEGNLVELDRQPGDAERIHEVFRHLHSIKGMASSMGYEDLAHLAHRLEDLMSPHRELDLALDAEEVDLLLRSMDEFRGQVDALGADQNPPPVSEPLLAEVEQQIRTLKRRLPAPQTEPLVNAPEPQAPAAITAGDSPEGTGAGVTLVATLDESCQAPGVRAFLLFRQVGKLGRVLSTEPSEEILRSGTFQERVIRFVVETDQDLAQIEKESEAFAELESIEISRQEAAAKPVEAEVAASESVSAAEKTSTPECAPAPRAAAATVRVQTELLDFFVDSVGELVTLRSHFEDIAERMGVPAMREGVRRFGKVVRKLHDRVMEVRMVPASLLTQRLPRVCRDLARASNKRIHFEIEGEKVELDRALIEALDTPMLHLLRNAVDHGIESHAERLAAGKPAEGNIQLKVRRGSDRVTMVLSDDGKGIDPEGLLRRAREKDIAVDHLEHARPEEIIELIFHPGFSTRKEISEVSGRGVGMDAVRKVLEGLGGRVTVQSRPGQGSSFVLDLPLTLAIQPVLLVDVADHLLALPAARVMKVLTLETPKGPNQGANRRLQLEDRSVALVELATLFGDRLGAVVEGSELATGVAEAILIGDEGQAQIALGVNRVAGHREVVLKGVGSMLKKLGPFGGTAVLGDGRPLLILDVDALVESLPQNLQEQGHGS